MHGSTKVLEGLRHAKGNLGGSITEKKRMHRFIPIPQISKASPYLLQLHVLSFIQTREADLHTYLGMVSGNPLVAQGLLPHEICSKSFQQTTSFFSQRLLVSSSFSFITYSVVKFRAILR